MSISLRSLPLSVLILGLISPLASAQDLKWGGQLTLSLPQGDTGNKQNLDGKPGFGLGFHALVDLKNGHAIVPRFDYLMYANGSPDPNHWAPGVELKNRLMMLGVDYQYHFTGKLDQGPYLLGGLAYGDMEYKAEKGGASIAASAKAPVLALGGGYQFSPRVGLELRYLSATFKPNDVSMTAPSLNASLFLRF